MRFHPTKIVLAAMAVAMCLVTSAPAQAVQCAIYARGLTGLQLHGDAYTWWDQAKASYDRGDAPKVGSVLVFQRNGKMRHGHVSVVSRIVNNRKILVDHANWTYKGVRKGAIARQIAVIDDSPNNDWTKVRVWHDPSNEYGTRAYPTYGFIHGGSTAKLSNPTFVADADDDSEVTKDNHAARRPASSRTARANSRGARVAKQQHGRAQTAHAAHGKGHVVAHDDRKSHGKATKVVAHAAPAKHGKAAAKVAHAAPVKNSKLAKAVVAKKATGHAKAHGAKVNVASR